MIIRRTAACGPTFAFPAFEAEAVNDWIWVLDRLLANYGEPGVLVPMVDYLGRPDFVVLEELRYPPPIQS